MTPPVSPTPVAPVAPAPASTPSVTTRAAAPAVPSGPLPDYGADLRPAGAVTPAAPAVPGSPAAPAPAGGGTTPTSGGTAVTSSGDCSAPSKSTAGAGGASAAAMAGTATAGGTAGAGAGTAGKRLAEQQDLQRKVDAVARQAPYLAWAAGLREDERTTVVTTDLAGGWIPPTVRLPAGVTLLVPAHGRRGTSAVGLLGAVIAAATHEPNTYITEADPHDPIPGTGERARYGRHLDELGPTLIDAAGGRYPVAAHRADRRTSGGPQVWRRRQRGRAVPAGGRRYRYASTVDLSRTRAQGCRRLDAVGRHRRPDRGKRGTRPLPPGVAPGGVGTARRV